MWFGKRKATMSRRQARRRDIFRFWDGGKWQTVDPLEIWQRIWTDGECDLGTEWPAAERGDNAALGNVTALIRRIFSLKEFDKGGLTRIECMRLLGDFLTFMHDLKKKLAPSQTSSPPTGSTSSEDPTESTTAPASDSSSTPTASENAAPMSSSMP